jgi:hypothetical protein
LFFSLVAVLIGTLGLLAPGCSNQSEGERCDTNDDNNGNDDCAAGLQCYPKADLVGNGATTDVCCPAGLVGATTAVCTKQENGPAGSADAAPPSEGGPSSDGAASDTGPTEAGAEAGAQDTGTPETGTDGGGSDAPADAVGGG